MKMNLIKTGLVMAFGLSTGAFAQTESFCSNAAHSGTSVKVSSNQVGKIGNIGYELWDENGSGGNATFYSDGSMDCNITSAKDYLCRAGLSLNSDKTYSQLDGDMVAEFKLIKNSGSNVQYSYIGVYGWMEGVSGTASQLVEYYVIDNTLSQSMPGSWIGDTKMGNITVDGGTYTVYRNTRTGPAIKNSGNVQFYQYFSVRSSPRDCGTINISEHMRQWEKMGLKMGKLYEAKVLGEAGNTGANVTGGRMDFPHARVYIGEAPVVEPPKQIERSAFKSMTIPGTIEAEDFDNGNSGVSYDGATGPATDDNADTKYRGSDYSQVDIMKSGTSRVIGYTSADEWLEYTVNVAEAGEYNVTAAVSNGNGDGSITVKVGSAKTDLSFSKTADWDTYTEATGKMTLAAGKQTVRITINTASTNVDFVKFAKPSAVVASSSSTVPVASSSSVVPTSSAAVPTSSATVPTSSATVPTSSASNPVVDPASSASMGLGVQFELAVGKNFQVFDMQGRLMGSIELNNGASLSDAIKAQFGRAGVYMLKQSNGRMFTTRVK